MPRDNENQKSSGLIASFLAQPNDSTSKTIFMTVAVCLVCAVFVAFAAVALKPIQDSNKLADKRKNILAVAGLDDASLSIEERFTQIESQIVDLQTGEYVTDIDVESYDQRDAARDPDMSISLDNKDDIAGLNRRANYAKIYLLKNEQGQTSKIILPVHGYGLWSTMYGFVSLEPDLSTIYRMKFYDHGETPGLGGEVDNPNWRKLWTGKAFFNENNEYNFNVVKGNVDPNSTSAQHQVDGLAGATLTSVGVNNLFRYWLSDQGFGPYIEKLRSNIQG